MKRLSLLMSVVMIAAFMAVACVPAAAPEARTGPEVKTSEKTEEGGRDMVIIGDPQSLEFLNVMYTQGGNSLNAAKLAQRGLLWIDPDGNWIPEAAKEVPSEANGGIQGNTIIYHLKEGLTFHDGSELTADDFEATWEAIMNPDNTPITRQGYKEIESIEIPDEYTLRVTFKEAYAPWRNLFDFVFPREVIEANTPGLDDSEAMREPVGIGPYEIVEWKPGEFIEYKAFDDYLRGRPKIDRLIWRIIPSSEALAAAIEAKEVDIARSSPSAYMPRLRKLAEQGVIDLVPPLGGGRGAERYHMNPEVPIFQDRRVRLALHHAIDRQRIIDDVLKVRAEIPVPSEWNGHPFVNPNLEPYEYDPDKARQLLDEVGWRDEDGDGIREAHNVGYGEIEDGTPLSFVHTTTTESKRRENVQLAIREMYKQVGIDMKIENRRSAILFTTWNQGGGWAHGDYEMGGWSDSVRTPDPDISDRFLCSEIPSEDNPGGSQWMHYCNPRVDELLLQQQKELDREKRKQLLWEAQEIIHQDAYSIYLYAQVRERAINADLKNYINAKFFPLAANAHEWSW